LKESGFGLFLKLKAFHQRPEEVTLPHWLVLL